MREIRLTFDIPPSVNHCYRRVRKKYVKNGKTNYRVMDVLTSKALKWLEKAKDEGVTVLKETGWEILKKEKAVAEVWVYWPDRRRRDTHNLHKLLCDALEGVVVEDDRWLLVRDMDFEVDRENPRVEVRAYRHGCERQDTEDGLRGLWKPPVGPPPLPDKEE